MLIERTDNEVIIRIPSYVDTNDLQKLIDFISYKEVTAKTKANQNDIDKLATTVKKGWWKKNKSRLIKE